VVLSAYQQIRKQTKPILSEEIEDNFDRAFDYFRPIIQGRSEAGPNVAGDDLGESILFLAEHAFEPSESDSKKTVESQETPEAREKALAKAMSIIVSMRQEDIVHINNFTSNTLSGLRLRMKRGEIGLERVT
jgi:flavine halogenase